MVRKLYVLVMSVLMLCTAAAWSVEADSAVSGPVFVAQDVSRDLITTLHARVADVRVLNEEVAQYQTIQTIASDTGLPSMAVIAPVNNQYLARFWGGGLGTWQNANKRKDATGYKYEGYGAILGFDRVFGPVVAGISAAYIEGDYKERDARRNDSTIKNYAGDIYLTYSACSGFFATVMAGYTYSDNDLRMDWNGDWQTRDFHTSTWRAGGKLGYDFAPTERLTISPSVGANFFHSQSKGHGVYENNIRQGRMGKMRHNNVEIPAEVRVAYQVRMTDHSDLTLMANGGYAYNLNDQNVYGTDTELGGAPERHHGRQQGHNMYTAGAGVKYRNGQWDLGVKYDYLARSKYDSHRVMGSIGYSF